MLATVWFGAALGLVLNFFWLDAPKWVSVLAYVAVGWVGVITIPQMLSGVGLPGSVLVMIGGVLYTLGAIVYATTGRTRSPPRSGFTRSSTCSSSRRRPCSSSPSRSSSCNAAVEAGRYGHVHG